MTLHKLRGAVVRLAATAKVRRCSCGALLPMEIAKRGRIDVKDEYRPPIDLEALLPLATDAERQELQALLNRALEWYPETEWPELRFNLTGYLHDNPRCRECGAKLPLDLQRPVHCIIATGPAPFGLLDALRTDKSEGGRFAELETALRRRAGDETRTEARRDAETVEVR